MFTCLLWEGFRHHVTVESGKIQSIIINHNSLFLTIRWFTDVSALRHARTLDSKGWIYKGSMKNNKRWRNLFLARREEHLLTHCAMWTSRGIALWGLGALVVVVVTLGRQGFVLHCFGLHWSVLPHSPNSDQCIFLAVVVVWLHCFGRDAGEGGIGVNIVLVSTGQSCHTLS